MLRRFLLLFTPKRVSGPPPAVQLYAASLESNQALALLRDQLAKAEARAEKYETLYLDLLNNKPKGQAADEDIPEQKGWAAVREKLEAQSLEKLRKKLEEGKDS